MTEGLDPDSRLGFTALTSADISSTEKHSWQALPFGDKVDYFSIMGTQLAISIRSEADGNLALEICRQQFCPLERRGSPMEMQLARFTVQKTGPLILLNERTGP